MKKFIEKMFETTTKQLTFLVAFTWFATVVMSFVSTIVWDVDIVFILTAVSGTFSIVLPSYLVKSYSENKQKYSNIAEDVSDFVSDTMNNLK